MLRVIVSTSSAAAKSYYSTGLSREDYYAKDKSQEIIGNWGGKGATLLGLSGTVDKEQFSKLCDNINPLTDEQLTARQNENRRVGYDLNFHAPKSVSICYSLNEDEKIMDAFRESVRDAMTELEKDMQVRVRAGGKNENRDTGNLLYGEFIHTTARPVGGIPDPHLHAHCFTFNASFDSEEQKWKAGEFGNIKQSAPYYEAFFHSTFSTKLQALGYNIERTERGWEITGIDRNTIEKFSARTTEIETIAEEKGITSAKAKDQLGAKTRSHKAKDLSHDELKTAWEARLTGGEKATVAGAGKAFAVEKKNGLGLDAEKAVDHSFENAFERKSSATEKEILTQAMKFSFGTANPDDIKNSYQKKEVLKFKTDTGTVLTTKEAIEEEKKLVRLATEGKGKFAPIYNRYEPENPLLNPEQKQAVTHALSSKNRVVIIEGGAGTGKTTLMKELAAGIEKTGRKIYAFAPSAEASRGVLQSEGFGSADTVARLIADPDKQKQLKNNVLWIDEAGLLGNKAMNQVLEIAKYQNARLILTGDTRQHTAVERGDALRILIEKSKIKPVRVNEIQRQKSRADYKQAVKLISENKLDEGFTKLDQMGAIHEIMDTTERHKTLAREYADALRDKKSVLVVAPTHIEGEQVTTHIRHELKKENLLNGEERTLTVQKNLSPTEAQKKDPVFYQPGQSVQFHQNAKGFTRGGIFDVVGKDENGNVLVNGKGQKEPAVLPMQEAGKFSVFEKSEIKLTAGDKIRITQNGFSENKKRMNNGNILTVKGFDKTGNILAVADKQEIVIGKDYRNLTYGYCTTSHSSQGKTVDKVLIAQSSMSLGAASTEQFYVSVSRGKTEVGIFTDNKKELQENVTRSTQRMTADDVAQRARQQQQAARNTLAQRQRLVNRLATLAKVKYERTMAAAKTFTQKVTVKR